MVSISRVVVTMYIRFLNENCTQNKCGTCYSNPFVFIACMRIGLDILVYARRLWYDHSLKRCDPVVASKAAPHRDCESTLFADGVLIIYVLFYFCYVIIIESKPYINWAEVIILKLLYYNWISSLFIGLRNSGACTVR